MEDKAYDCVMVGAGPGGLQAAIYLGRSNRDVLLLDRGGGRKAMQNISKIFSHKRLFLERRL